MPASESAATDDWGVRGPVAVPPQAWCGRCTVSPLVIGLRAIWLSPYRAGLADLRFACLWSVPRSQQAMVPSDFRRQVSWVTPDVPSYSGSLRERSIIG